MSDGDRTPEERLVAVETILPVVIKWQDKADGKLDSLLESSRKAITLEALEGAFTAHVVSCPARISPNPGPKKNDINGKLNGKVDMMLKGYRGLGVVGSLLLVTGGLLIVICKLIEVF